MNHLSHAGGTAVDPVDVAEVAPRGVVIDIDVEERFQPAQPGALQPVAFEQDHRVVRSVDAHRGANRVGAGQTAVDGRDSVGGNQVGALAHLLQQHARGQHGAHRVAVGTRMRAHQEPLAAANHFQDGRYGFVLREIVLARSGSGISGAVRHADSSGVTPPRLFALLARRRLISS